MYYPHTDLTKRVRRPKGPKAISRKTHRCTRVCHPAAISSKLHSFMPINRQSSHPTLISRRRHSRQARAKRRAICEICEICVKISHLCENVLMRLP